MTESRDEYGFPIEETPEEKANKDKVTKDALLQAEIDRQHREYNNKANSIWTRLQTAKPEADPATDEMARDVYRSLRGSDIKNAEYIVSRAEKAHARELAFERYAKGEITTDEARKAGIVQ
jgi:hypothetical protein